MGNDFGDFMEETTFICNSAPSTYQYPVWVFSVTQMVIFPLGSFISFICGLLNNSVSISDYIRQNDRIIKE
jgi:hypothetical protein